MSDETKIELMQYTMNITLQPFFVFYASRLKEFIKIVIVQTPPGVPSMNVLHHESKLAALSSLPSSRFKERVVQLCWHTMGHEEEQNITFTLPLCAYGNETLRLSFQWPTGEHVTTKPIMITSSEQILQALAKYNVHYQELTLNEKIVMLNGLQQVEWKLDRNFDSVEVQSLDQYFRSDLDRLLAWLTDRMKLVTESSELRFLWNRGYLMACDDERVRLEMTSWFASWNQAIQSESASDSSVAERLAVLETMAPKTFALRIKMSGTTPLAFTMCNEVVRHRLQMTQNILSNLARADLQCLYNIRLKQVDMVQNVLIDPEYKDACPSADGYYEEYDGSSSWASLSFSTFNAFSSRNRELEEALRAANATIAAKDQEIAFLQGEIERLRGLSQSSIPTTLKNRPIGIPIIPSIRHSMHSMRLDPELESSSPATANPYVGDSSLLDPLGLQEPY